MLITTLQYTSSSLQAIDGFLILYHTITSFNDLENIVAKRGHAGNHIKPVPINAFFIKESKIFPFCTELA